MYKTYINFILFVSIVAFGSSCVSTQKTTYFNNAQDASYIPSIKDSSLITIQKNDILSIVIASLSAEASAIFNTTNTTTTSYTTTGGYQSTGGYLVNSDGFIELPILGNIKVEGLTKKELKEKITNILIEKKLLKEPIVSVRQLNFEITVLGEVGRPSVITVPSEKVSLIKALGLAGDITIYGEKSNVTLIRESNGKRMVTHIDLNSADFLTSPYYYLQPNDVIYVESNKNKVASVSRTRQSLPVIISSLSVLLIALTYLKK
jgi:polysaccharide export outer membrane protein